MARKIKNLSVKTREYKDRDGNPKANWQNIGVIMENDQGKQFMLIDRWVNLAGLPDFSDKPNPSAVMVSIFDADNNYQPGNHHQVHQRIKVMIIQMIGIVHHKCQR